MPITAMIAMKNEFAKNRHSGMPAMPSTTFV